MLINPSPVIQIIKIHTMLQSRLNSNGKLVACNSLINNFQNRKNIQSKKAGKIGREANWLVYVYPQLREVEAQIIKQINPRSLIAIREYLKHKIPQEVQRYQDKINKLSQPSYISLFIFFCFLTLTSFVAKMQLGKDLVHLML